MRLTDNLKDLTADLEDYIKNVELEKLASVKMIDMAAEEMMISREVISALKDSNTDKDQEIFNLKTINEIQKNRLTELSVKVDEAMKFVDQVRIVLFDVVRMYQDLEAANDTRRTD